VKKQVVFIQGGGAGAYEADGKLLASLRRALRANYEVKYPKMPNEDQPDYDSWGLQINKELAALDGEIILVGHSVGGYILIKYLTEGNVPKKQIIGICLIAAPYPGGDENWQFEGFSLSEDFGTKLPKDAKVFLYHSPDDQIVPFTHMALYAKKLTQATVRQTSGGHQLNNDLSIVAKDLKDLK
jgi:uncharacterized protein